MQHDVKKRKIILKLIKVISFFLIISSISGFYFERISYLQEIKQWEVNLIEKGENVYRGYKTVWDELSDNQKEIHRLRIKRTENRIEFHSHLILVRIYNLALNIVLFTSLFILKPWVKKYLVFWLLSDLLLVPFYYYIIGYDHLLRFELLTFNMKIASLIAVSLIFLFNLLVGRYLFKLIDLKNAKNT